MTPQGFFIMNLRILKLAQELKSLPLREFIDYLPEAQKSIIGLPTPEMRTKAEGLLAQSERSAEVLFAAQDALVVREAFNG